MASFPITQKYLKSILDYNPETGIFTWRKRPLKHFKNLNAYNTWNTCFSGKQAGFLSQEYIQIQIGTGHKYYAHVLAWIYINGKKPNKHIDHINGNKNDNKLINLRLATASQNGANSKKSKNNTSGYKGVSFKKRDKKWRAQIQIKSKRIELGLFSTPEEAHAAYCEAAKKLHGEFARFD